VDAEPRQNLTRSDDVSRAKRRAQPRPLRPDLGGRDWVRAASPASLRMRARDGQGERRRPRLRRRPPRVRSAANREPSTSSRRLGVPWTPPGCDRNLRGLPGHQAARSKTPSYDDCCGCRGRDRVTRGSRDRRGVGGDTVVCGGNAVVRLARAASAANRRSRRALVRGLRGRQCKTCWAGLADVLGPWAKASRAPVSSTYASTQGGSGAPGSGGSAASSGAGTGGSAGQNVGG
jgi:hypothetical protein